MKEKIYEWKKEIENRHDEKNLKPHLLYIEQIWIKIE